MNSYNMVTSESDIPIGRININDYKQFEIPEDKKILKNMYSHASSMAVADFFYSKLLKGQFAYNRILVRFLKKEYHLEKE